MMTVGIDDAQLQAWASKAGSEFRRAAIIGINRTAEDALAATRTAIQGAFTVRVPGFILPPVQLPREWRASEQNGITATIAIGDGGPRKMGERRRNILEPFETGKPKRAHTTPVFIPTRALRPSRIGLVDPKMYPRNLLGIYKGGPGELTGLKRGRGAKTRGKFKTIRDFHSYFMVENAVNPKANGIYERYGPGPKQVRMIWAARQSVPRPAILRWEVTVKQAIDARLIPNMEGAIRYALDTLAYQQGKALGKTIGGSF